MMATFLIRLPLLAHRTVCKLIVLMLYNDICGLWKLTWKWCYKRSTCPNSDPCECDGEGICDMYACMHGVGGCACMHKLSLYVNTCAL